MTPALLFDLDETLVADEASASAAFLATAEHAATRHEVDPARLALDARSQARDLWHAAPTIDYCLRVGISSWEGLWCRYEGDGPGARLLRERAPRYRREAWALALAEQGVDDPPLAAELGERFAAERRSRHQVLPGAAEALAELRPRHAMAVVTNGASCLQREKLDASGLGRFFDAVVVSEDVGAAKPAPEPFETALSILGAAPADAVMIGDSLRKDIEGALAAGLAAIWLNPDAAPLPAGRERLAEVPTLTEVPRALALLSKLGAGRVSA